MNCKDVRDNLSLYIDDELNDDDKKLMDEHLKNCSECSKELDEYRKLIQILNELPDEEPPAGYCNRLHEKLLSAKNEEKTEITELTDISRKNKSNKYKWVKYAGLAASLALVLLVYGLNNLGYMSKSSNEMAYDTAESPAEAPSYGYPEAEEAPMEPASPDLKGGSYEYATENQKDKIEEEMGFRAIDARKISLMAADEKELKIIKTGNLYVQTKDYDRFLDEITSKIDSLGGYIENNNTEVYQVYNDEKLMHGSLKIRVPQDAFYETVSFLEQTTDIRRKSIKESDVTKEYYEKDNKVKNLEVQEQHLRDLFDKATTVEEMLQIENELRRIRTEIDSLNISLADIDDRASMSTIDLEVEEVKEVNFTLQSKKGVWERAKEGFINTVNGIVRGFGNLIVKVVSSSPILIPVIIVFVILLLKIKKYWKKKL